MIFQDHLGRNVELKECPKRIVSLVPSQTELLFDLGLREEVAGITKFCVHPDEWYRSKERVGGTKKLNLDKIRELKPDLILANKEENNREDIASLSAEFPVWVSDVKTLDDAKRMILDIGEITCRSEAAVKLQKTITEYFDILGERLEKVPFMKALYLIWSNPDMAAGSDTFIHDMLSRSGFSNVISETRYPEIDQIKFETPDVVLLSSEPFPFKQKHIDEFQLKYPNARIMIVDGEMFSWYGSRLLKAPDYFLSLLEQR